MKGLFGYFTSPPYLSLHGASLHQDGAYHPSGGSPPPSALRQAFDRLMEEREWVVDACLGDEESAHGRGGILAPARELLVARDPQDSGAWWNDTLYVVFSGNLYNKEELRPVMMQSPAEHESLSTQERWTQAAGHHQSSGRPTGRGSGASVQNPARQAAQLLGEAYHSEGVIGVAKLCGRFIAVVFDKSNETAFLVRDRGGEANVAYSFSGGHLLFSTTMQDLVQLRRAINLPVGLDLQSAVDFLSLGCIPGGGTLVQHCRVLRPHEYLRVSKGGELDVIGLGSPLEGHGLSHVVSDLREADRLLLRSVAHRSGQSGPVGICPAEDLNAFGGLMNERSVVALAVEPQAEAESNDEVVKTETPRTRLLQRRPIIAKEEGEPLLRRLAQSSLNPIGDASVLPRAILLDIARHHFALALTDDGVEAVCATHHTLDWLAQLRWIPRGMRTAVSRLGSGGPAGLKRFLTMPAAAAALASFGGFVAKEKEKLLAPGLASSGVELKSFRAAAERHGIPLEWPTIENLHKFEVDELVPYSVLPTVCALTAMTGVSLRPIFLDPLFLDHVRSCPLTERQLWWMMRRSLPRRFRRRKNPRAVHRAYWGLLARGPLRPAIESLFQDERGPIFALLSVKECRRYTQKFFEGSDERAVEVWNLVSLASWLREHLTFEEVAASLSQWSTLTSGTSPGIKGNAAAGEGVCRTTPSGNDESSEATQSLTSALSKPGGDETTKDTLHNSHGL